MSKEHTGDRPYKCLHCDKTFSVKCDLSTHMKKNIGKTSFECSQCNKAFLSKCRLQQHKKVHSVEKQFQCTICDKKFKLKNSLSKHLKIHKILPDETGSSREQIDINRTETAYQILKLGPNCPYQVTLQQGVQNAHFPASHSWNMQNY